MSDNNGTGQIGDQKIGTILGQEKDPRWDDFKIVMPFISEAVEWLDEPKIWDGNLPTNWQDCKEEIRFVIAEACFKSFNAALEEVGALCRALLLASDDEDYPEKYLPKD